jgi:hypothetical protein
MVSSAFGRFWCLFDCERRIAFIIRLTAMEYESESNLHNQPEPNHLNPTNQPTNQMSIMSTTHRRHCIVVHFLTYLQSEQDG